MQIKFRCQYCQQLLGISKSRAGARVDCPGCGRTINVPGAAVQDPRDASDEPAAGRDNSLDEALASLIRLSESGNKPRPPASPPSEKGRETVEPTIPDFDEAAIVIRELASEAPVALPQSSSDRPVGGASRENLVAPRGVPFLLTAFLCVSSFLCGGLALEAWNRFTASTPRTAGNVQTGDSSSDVLEDLRKAEEAESAHKTEVKSEKGQVTGVVKWITDAGKTEPDALALVLVVPKRNAPGLKLDGRSLREAQETTDQKALRAALREFGIIFVRAKEDGSFAVARPSSEESELIIVSRHRSRPEGVELPVAISESLSQYFESGLSFVGQLAVKSVPLPAVVATGNASAEAASSTTSEPLEIVVEAN